MQVYCNKVLTLTVVNTMPLLFHEVWVLHFVSLGSPKLHNYLVNPPLNSLDLLDRDMLFKLRTEKELMDIWRKWAGNDYDLINCNNGEKWCNGIDPKPFNFKLAWLHRVTCGPKTLIAPLSSSEITGISNMEHCMISALFFTMLCISIMLFKMRCSSHFEPSRF